MAKQLTQKNPEGSGFSARTPLRTSESGLQQLIKHEGKIDGIYNDVSGYATCGVGHLIAKRRSLLIAGAEADAALTGKLSTHRLGKAQIKYLPSSLSGSADLEKIVVSAKTVAQEIYSQKLHQKSYEKLTAAEKGAIDQRIASEIKAETDALGKTTVGVLGDDVKKFDMSVNSLVTTDLTQKEHDTLVSFTFNVGQANLTSSTLLNVVNQGGHRSGSTRDRDAAIKRIEAEFKRWNKSGGKVVKGLLDRRSEEAEGFLEDARRELNQLIEEEKRSNQSGRNMRLI